MATYIPTKIDDHKIRFFVIHYLTSVQTNIFTDPLFVEHQSKTILTTGVEYKYIAQNKFPYEFVVMVVVQQH